MAGYLTRNGNSGADLRFLPLRGLRQRGALSTGTTGA